jgi:chorismate mutase
MTIEELKERARVLRRCKIRHLAAKKEYYDSGRSEKVSNNLRETGKDYDNAIKSLITDVILMSDNEEATDLEWLE